MPRTFAITERRIVEVNPDYVVIEEVMKPDDNGFICVIGPAAEATIIKHRIKVDPQCPKLLTS